MAVRQHTNKMNGIVSSREGKIASLVENGMGNIAIWAAMEAEYPSIIKDDDERRNHKSKSFIKDLPKYNKLERDRVGRAINSTRGLSIKLDQEMQMAADLTGGNNASIQRPEDVELENRHRFSTGIPSMDFIFGETKFIHLSDAPNSKYRSSERIMRTRDADGKMHESKVPFKEWISGDWRVGDPMIPMVIGSMDHGFQPTRKKGELIVTPDMLKTQIVQHGFPEGLMSVWGGEHGVGKSRLATMLSKSIHRTIFEPTLYVNSEATPEDMRSWMGHDVDNNLFNLINGEMIPLQKILDAAYAIRPRWIVVDSKDAILEFNKGESSIKSALAQLKLLKQDIAAGRPHITLISQLNGQGKLRGGTTIPHIVDIVCSVRKIPNQKGRFLFEIPSKNRGGITGRGAPFQHTDTTVEAVSNTMSSKPLYTLMQPATGAIARGLESPPIVTEEVAEVA